MPATALCKTTDPPPRPSSTPSNITTIHQHLSPNQNLTASKETACLKLAPEQVCHRLALNPAPGAGREEWASRLDHHPTLPHSSAVPQLLGPPSLGSSRSPSPPLIQWRGPNRDLISITLPQTVEMPRTCGDSPYYPYPSPYKLLLLYVTPKDFLLFFLLQDFSRLLLPSFTCLEIFPT